MLELVCQSLTLQVEKAVSEEISHVGYFILDTARQSLVLGECREPDFINLGGFGLMRCNGVDFSTRLGRGGNQTQNIGSNSS